MVGQEILVLFIMVRIRVLQPHFFIVKFDVIGHTKRAERKIPVGDFFDRRSSVHRST